jgi:AAA domain
MQRKIIIVIGPSGSGKTRTVSTLIDGIDRVAVFDLVTDDQYIRGEETVIIEGRPKDFARAIGALGPINPSVPKEKEKFTVIYHPNPALVTTLNNGLIDSPEFEPIVRVCHERGDMYLVIDEAHLLCNSHNCPPELMKVNLVGRHKQLSMILVAQQFNGIHPAIRENADEFYFYKVIRPATLKSIAETCGDDVAIQVGALRAVELDENEKFKTPGQRLHWTKFKGIVEVTE